MASPGAEPETMLTQTTVVSCALQTLVGRLVLNGTLNKADLLAMRRTGLQLAADLRAHGATGAQVAGERLEGAMGAWWDMAVALGDG